MGKIRKRKTKKVEEKEHEYIAEDVFPLVEEETEGDHIVDGYKVFKQNHYERFNDDLGIDENDYEVEQERYAVQSEDTQPIAVDRYFERFGKSRRTPR
jgi:type I restriction-modification system DNA methylase subunit